LGGGEMSEDSEPVDLEQGGGDIQDFILARELAEVYLLLDNISSARAKEIPDNADPIFGRNKDKTWLEQICEITWPPVPVDRAQEAANAAKLLRAKDILNLAAAPATGASIAFTLTVVGEYTGDNRPGWQRLWAWLSGVTPPAATVSRRTGLSSGGHGNGGNGNNGGGNSDRKPPSRASLAALAYPTFAHRAFRYRFAFVFLILFLIGWLMITCVASWDVATGSSLLNRVNALEAARIVTATPPPAPPSTEAPAATTAARPAPPPAGQTTAAAPRPAPGGAPATTSQSTAAAPPAANPAAEADDRRQAAADNLRHWLEEPIWLRRLLRAGMGSTGEKSVVTIGPKTDRVNVEWAAVFVGVLAGTILPIFYGLLGSAAAVVRSISAKLRDSTLMPRDLSLAYIQLALGAVIGACVGLFVTSDGDAAQAQGLLGSVHLSAPALCFVAGFGVEGVFLALESLLRRVFNITAS